MSRFSEFVWRVSQRPDFYVAECAALGLTIEGADLRELEEAAAGAEALAVREMQERALAMSRAPRRFEAAA